MPSGGLKGLGRQAELLRTGIRTLGGALVGVATVGGLAALVDRSISAADAVGKTADKIGVGVEALQELRFAAKASGVEQQTKRDGLTRLDAIGDAIDRLDRTGMGSGTRRAGPRSRAASPRRRGQPPAAGAGGWTSSSPFCAAAACASPPPATVTVGRANSIPLALKAFLIMP